MPVLIGLLIGLLSFVIVFLILHRHGGLVRHLVAFIVTIVVSLAATVLLAVFETPLGPSTEQVVAIWAPPLILTVAGLILATLFAMLSRWVRR